VPSSTRKTSPSPPEGAHPGHVSICGYDNTFFAATPHLSLTTISQPRREMGQLAVAHFLERLAGRSEPIHQVLAPELVVRGSTDPPRGHVARECSTTSNLGV